MVCKTVMEEIVWREAFNIALNHATGIHLDIKKTDVYGAASAADQAVLLYRQRALPYEEE